MRNQQVLELLERWPSRAAVLEDAQAVESDLAIVAVHRWYSRTSIPSRYWYALLRGAQERGIGLKPEDFMKAHSCGSENFHLQSDAAGGGVS